MDLDISWLLFTVKENKYTNNKSCGYKIASGIGQLT
jgi:hypothetical protein